MTKLMLSALFVMGLASAAGAEQGPVTKAVAAKSQAFHALGNIKGALVMTDQQLAAVEGANIQIIDGVRYATAKGGTFPVGNWQK